MKMRQVVWVADRDNALRIAAQIEARRMQSLLFHHLEVELLRLLAISMLRQPVDLLGNLEDQEQADGETDPPDGCDLLGKKIHHRGGEQDEEGERQAERKVFSAGAQ